jgi:FeS assembly SUF system regulator
MLRITRQSDYGIVLMTLFTRDGSDADNGTVLSARDMSLATNLPLPTVSKILKALTRGGILNSTRGVKGGYSLTRNVEAISVAEVIEAIEGPIAMTDCVDESGRDCIIQDSCPCSDNWQRVNTAVRDALAAIPLSTMNSGCRFDPEALAAENTPADDTAAEDAAAENTAADENRTTVDKTEETDGQNELE